MKENVDKPVAIEQTCNELQGEKHGQSLVFTNYIVESRGKPGSMAKGVYN